MKNNQMKNSRISKLSKGKVKGVGFFEKVSLKIAGFIDRPSCALGYFASADP